VFGENHRNVQDFLTIEVPIARDAKVAGIRAITRFIDELEIEVETRPQRIPVTASAGDSRAVSDEDTGAQVPPENKGDKPSSNLAAWLTFAGVVVTGIVTIVVAAINKRGGDKPPQPSPSVAANSFRVLTPSAQPPSPTPIVAQQIPVAVETPSPTPFVLASPEPEWMFVANQEEETFYTPHLHYPGGLIGHTFTSTPVDTMFQLRNPSYKYDNVGGAAFSNLGNHRGPFG
jgi:hypothetical protein